jgi:hypothetical protein
LGGTRSPIGTVSRAQETSARDIEESGTGILLTPERPVTQSGGIAETVIGDARDRKRASALAVAAQRPICRSVSMLTLVGPATVLVLG